MLNKLVGVQNCSSKGFILKNIRLKKHLLFPCLGRPMSKDEDLTKQFAAACCSAATESGAQSIDLYTAMKKQEVNRPSSFQHFT